MSERAVVLELVRAAETALERNRARLDDLNVFPVPDGDTGTNMLLTVRAVTETLQQSVAESDRGRPGRGSGSRGTARGSRKLRRDPVADRAGSLRSPGRRRAGRCRNGGEGPPPGLRRGLRRRAGAQGGDDPDRDSRARGGGGSRNRSGHPAALLRARAPGRRSGRADARPARGPPQGRASSTPGRPGSSRSCAASRRTWPASRCRR